MPKKPTSSLYIEMLVMDVSEEKLAQIIIYMIISFH